MVIICDDVVDALVEEGIAVFTHDALHGDRYFPNGVPKYNVLAWLFSRCAEAGPQLTMLERDQVVERVHLKANKALKVPGYGLTVARLREVLQGLPENIPVLYERIEDVLFEKNGWTAIPLTWDMYPAADSHIEQNRRAFPDYSARKGV